MVLVAASCSSASIAASVPSAPTRSSRSRPPTPMPCDTPPPRRAIRQDTSCSPVPEAETRPMSPRGTTLANAIGVPAMSAVPQSGPHQEQTLSFASSLSARSSSIGTLEENTSACRPRCSALRASAAANSPGTEISARFAPGSVSSAPPRLRARDRPSLCGSFRLDQRRPRERRGRLSRSTRAHRDDEIVHARLLALGREQSGFAQQRLVGRAADHEGGFLHPGQRAQAPGEAHRRHRIEVAAALDAVKRPQRTQGFLEAGERRARDARADLARRRHAGGRCRC